jgi:glutaconate CoA-transferase subunit A
LREKAYFFLGGKSGFGLLHRFRDAVENGWPRPLEIEEYSHGALAAALAAGAARLPFGVLRGDPRNDLFKHTPAFAPMTCPFTGETVTAVRAISPDVTVIHAQRADPDGNVQLWGIVGIQKEAVLAAKKVIVTVEELCETLEPVANGIVIPSWVIDAIVQAPGGARPSYVQGYYRRDTAFYREWDVIARDRERFVQWMEKHVLERAAA